jgi:hypothetical protein
MLHQTFSERYSYRHQTASAYDFVSQFLPPNNLTIYKTLTCSECEQTAEAHWTVSGLNPNHHPIENFSVMTGIVKENRTITLWASMLYQVPI